MRLTQKSLLQPTWEYEVSEARLVIREKSPFRLHESTVPLAAIDLAARADSTRHLRYLVLAIAMLVPIAALGYQAFDARELGFLGFTLFFLPLLAYGVYKFAVTGYNHLVFDTYEGNAKSYFRLRRDNPSRAEVEKFVDYLKAEAKKIRYRDDLPDDKKLELVQRHLEFLRHSGVITDAELADLGARAKRRFIDGKVTVLNPAANSPMGADG